MTKRYTDEDVKRLVVEAGRTAAAINHELSLYPNGYHVTALENALAPFRPDPEEELIEAMAEADFKSWNPNSKWEKGSPAVKEGFRKGIRAALAVVKERYDLQQKDRDTPQG